jgi:glycosyltransferase involved in cell wall biosynthesis
MPTKKHNILYISTTPDLSGYGAAARNYVKALHRSNHNVEVRGVKFDRFTYTPDDEERIINAQKFKDYDFVIQHLTPEQYGRFVPGGATKCKQIGYMAWETTKISWGSWVDKMNEMNAMCVPCADNKKALLDSGVTVPIFIVPHCFDTSKYDLDYSSEGMEIKNATSAQVKYYSIFQLSNKKGLDVMLKSYFAAFKDNPDDVCLILKTYIDPFKGEGDLKKVKDYITSVKKDIKLTNHPPIILLTDMLSDPQVYNLHQICDAFVLPSRGEGWCIPAFDALGFGKIPIATNWGGIREYLSNDNGFPIDYELQPCWGMPHTNLYTGHEQWAEPSVASLITQFKTSFDLIKHNTPTLQKMREAGRETVKKFDLKNHNWNQVFDSLEVN